MFVLAYSSRAAYVRDSRREKEGKLGKRGEQRRWEQRETIRVREPARCAAYWGDRHRQADSNALHCGFSLPSSFSLAPLLAATTQCFPLSFSQPFRPFLSLFLPLHLDLHYCRMLSYCRRICPLQLHSWNEMLLKNMRFFFHGQLERSVERIN